MIPPSRIKTFERILLAFICAGLVMKGFRLPFSSTLLILGLSSLAIVYFRIARSLFATPTPHDQIPPLSTVSGIVLSIAMIGILFKIQLWPSSGLYLSISIVSSAALGLWIFLKRTGRPDLGPYFTSLLRRVVPTLVVVVLLYALPERELLDYYYRDQPGKAELLERLRSAPDRATRERLTREVDSLESRAQGTGRAESSPSDRER